MNLKKNKIIEDTDTSKKNKSKGGKVLKWIGFSFAALVLLIIGAIIGLSLYFTPERIAEIISKEASENMDADIKIQGFDYTLFSTYPELHVTIDSLAIISRSLDGLSEKERKSLPENAMLLASTGRLKVDLNVRQLMKNIVDIKELEIDSPFANLLVVNDSTNNFNIIPPEKKKHQLPEIIIRNISLTKPVKIQYADLSKDISVAADIDRLTLHETPEEYFDMNFGIDLRAMLPMMEKELNLKAEVGGKLFASINPLAVKAKDLTIDLDGISLGLDGDVKQENDKFIADNLNVEINVPNILNLPEKLPEGLIEMPEVLSQLGGNIPLKLTLALLSPYTIPTTLPEHFSLDMLPPVDTQIFIDNGQLLYIPPKGQNIEIDNISFNAGMRYNPQKPEDNYINLAHLSLNSDDIFLNLKADVEEPFSNDALIRGNLEARTALEKSISPLLISAGYSLKGNLLADTDFSFRLQDYSNPKFEDVKISGNISSSLLSFSQKGNLKGDVKALDVTFDGSTPTATLKGTTQGELTLNISGEKASVNYKDLTALFSDFQLALDAAAGNNSGSSIGGSFDLSSTELNLKSGANILDVAGLALGIKGDLLKIPNNINSNYNPAPSGEDEQILLERVDHTPLTLSPTAPPFLAALITMADVNLDLKIDAGKFDTPYYQSVNLFSNLDLSTNLDNLLIRSLDLTTANSQMQMSGTVEGLLGFLASGSPSLLKGDFDINFNNVDINRLSGAYYAAVEKMTRKPYDFSMPPQGPYTAADSLCILLPRNLDATVRLKAKSAEYMGFTFSPLSTDILLHQGDATLSKLTIGTPYTTAQVDWTYSTRDVSDIHMDIAAHVKDFDFTRFFNVFPALSEKAPEITNLKGAIYADISGRFDMFPSMFMNAPSIDARFNIRGSGLSFSREGKIERITHLMMIKGDGPINITGLNINVTIHDNLIMMLPFKLSFDDYQLGFAGVNNFQGGMYYHLALEKSPFHLPFAVNIVGNFKHPEIRLGGTEVKDERERKISGNLDDSLDINIMTNLHRGWIMFVQEAAKYDLKRH